MMLLLSARQKSQKVPQQPPASTQQATDAPSACTYTNQKVLNPLDWAGAPPVRAQALSHRTPGSAGSPLPCLSGWKQRGVACAQRACSRTSMTRQASAGGEGVAEAGQEPLARVQHRQRHVLLFWHTWLGVIPAPRAAAEEIFGSKPLHACRPHQASQDCKKMTDAVPAGTCACCRRQSPPVMMCLIGSWLPRRRCAEQSGMDMQEGLMLGDWEEYLQVRLQARHEAGHEPLVAAQQLLEALQAGQEERAQVRAARAHQPRQHLGSMPALRLL